MAKPTNPEEQNPPVTEHVSAPATPTPAQPQWVMPRQKTVERQGDVSAPQVHFYPQVRGGICEYCGVIDPHQPSQYQYKLCPHYRGMQLRCTYCPASKDADDVIYHADLNVAEHPNDPNRLVVWCNSYECSKKHTERFQVNS